MTLKSLLIFFDIYKTQPFILTNGSKYISNTLSQLLSLLTLFYSLTQIIQLAQLRFSQNDFIVNDINLQFNGDMNVNVSGAQFMAAVSF